MPLCNEYIISSHQRYRDEVFQRARQARADGNEKLFRTYMRNAVALSYHSRIAKRRLREGLDLTSRVTTEQDRDAMEAHFEKHRKLLHG